MAFLVEIELWTPFARAFFDEIEVRTSLFRKNGVWTGAKYSKTRCGHHYFSKKRRKRGVDTTDHTRSPFTILSKYFGNPRTSLLIVDAGISSQARIVAFLSSACVRGISSEMPLSRMAQTASIMLQSGEGAGNPSIKVVP